MSTKYKISDPEKPYFLTFAVVEWVDVFTRPVYQQILLESLQFCQREKGLLLHGWCLMPNHLHLLASAADKYRLENILRDLKKYTSRPLLKTIEENSQESRQGWILWLFRSAGERNANNEKYQFWQQDNHPVELFSAERLQQKLDYVHYNPVRAGFVAEPEHWLYSSAMDYAGGKGLLEIACV